MSLPANTKTALKATSHGAHISLMNSTKHNIANANNIMRSVVVRMVDEGSPANARSVDKILNLPNG